MNDLAQVITALFVLFFVMVIYFLPFVIANARKHAIFFVNLLFGWTIFGWLICFIWAFGNPGHPQIIIYKEMK